MELRISGTEKNILNKTDNFMNHHFPHVPAQEIDSVSDDVFFDAIDELQEDHKALKNFNAQKKQNIDKIQNLLIEGSLSSEYLLSMYKESKKQIEHLVDTGVHPATIKIVDGNIEIKQKSDEPENISPRDRSQDKVNLKAFRKNNKGKSITDKLRQANKDENVLAALVDGTLHYLKNALKLSDDDISHYRLKVQDIYAHHGDRVSDAHTLYQYYDLQRRKDELKAMAFGTDKLCKQAYNVMSLNAHQNRRYKKDVTKILEAEEQRHAHLVEKYGNRKLEKGGKRGKEKRMLDDVIKAKKEELSTNRAFELFNATLEKFEKDILNNRDLDRYERKKRKDILKSARENFDRLYLHTTLSQIAHTLEKNHLFQKYDIRKYGGPLWLSRLNDVSSDGGAILAVGGSVVTGLTLAGIAV